MMYASDFRRKAREALSGRWALAVGTGLVAVLLGGTSKGGSSGGGRSNGSGYNNRYDLNDFLGFVNSDFGRVVISIFTALIAVLLLYALVIFFLGAAVELGYCKFNLNLINGTNPQFSDLFSRFNIFWKALGLRLVTTLFIILWSLLLIIPGIIAGFRYAMAPYIMAENPEVGIMEAIERSKKMMHGNKWRLFCLGISFIGWAILSALSCGIGFLWLVPYQNAAYAAFYNEVSGKNATNWNTYNQYN